MEDVLDVYKRPRDPARPLVCLDETSKQLVAETRAPQPMRRGQPARHDYEYKRNGTANLFLLFAPLEGWRHVEVTERRTAIDYANILRDLADIHFPGASKIVLVQDNLNTHSPASLYEAFEPAAASSNGSSGTTRPSTAAGSIWPNPNWRFYPANVSPAASPMPPRSPLRSRHGARGATHTMPRPTGTSRPPTLV